MQIPNKHFYLALLTILMLLSFPIAAQLLDLDFYISVVTRIIIFAIAATGLNLVLGYGGMVALGHAAFFGVGAYTVVIFSDSIAHNLIFIVLLSMLLSAVVAYFVGLVSLRTHGVYFIMITLAFAQMVYFFFVSLRQFNGEDGYNLYGRSPLLGLDTDDDTVFYYAVVILFLLCIFIFSRIVNSNFGKALVGIKENPSRMQALGFSIFNLKLLAFVISGAITGLAGALFADLNQFVSPSIMHWTQSAHLLVMVLIGGMGLRYGGVVGAVLILSLEEILRNYTEFWHLPMGVLLLMVLFLAPNGFASIWQKKMPVLTDKAYVDN